STRDTCVITSKPPLRNLYKLTFCPCLLYIFLTSQPMPFNTATLLSNAISLKHGCIFYLCSLVERRTESYHISCS
ncbi:hypothetical protein PMAYCL1PPCAC_05203, partial [Pristionchus mayeri]